MSLTELVRSLNTTCSITLQCNINKYFQDNLAIQTSFIVLISHESGEGLIQVVGESVLEEEVRFSMRDKSFTRKDEKKIDPSTFDFKEILSCILDPAPSHLVKIPVRHPDRHYHICFLVFLIEKDGNPKKEIDYSDFVVECFSNCSALLYSAFMVKEETRVKDMHQKLLVIANNFLLKIGDYNELLKDILFEARLMLKAERCSLFFLSEDKSEMVAKEFEDWPRAKVNEIRVPINSGILGLAARSGEIVNVRDAQNHPLFYKNIDDQTGFRTRNMLCVPIRDDQEHVVGVAQLCNKRNGLHFFSIDEEAAEAFSVYFSIVVIHSILYRRLQLVKARNRLSAELISYHITSNREECQRVLTCKEKHRFHEMLDFRFQCRTVPSQDAVCYIIKMFENLGVLKTWNMSRRTVAHFALAVKRGYRDLPYHNWMHAFSVAHFSYYLMQKLELMGKNLITDLEGTAFIVAALCHDLDHRGTTNSFQVISGSSLANLYNSDSSVLERHHFSQMLIILNSDECNIFENLTASQYERVLGFIRDFIIATDLSQHVKSLPDERSMSMKGFSPAKKLHRSLLLSLLISCCDLSDQLKGWLHCRDIAVLIYTEFFMQGDMEREMGQTPAEMMDRNRAFIPKLQLDFLTEICAPTFSVLAKIFPVADEYLLAIQDTMFRWERAMRWFKDNQIAENQSMEYIKDPDLVSFVLEQ